MVHLLRRWWEDRARGDIPDRADLNPADFRSILPNILISDVEHQSFRIRYRLVGTKVVEATGLDITGRYLDELIRSNEDEPWVDDYLLAYRTRRPVAGQTSIMLQRGLRFVYEFGLFPLRKGGTSIDQFVAVEDYFEFSHLFPDLPEWQVRDHG
jgi:hypothetical protein